MYFTFNTLYDWLDRFPSWQLSRARVVVGTREWVGYHEAGHVAAALTSRKGELSEVTIICPPGEPPYGVTRATGAAETAVGGHAVELALQRRGRLRSQDGSLLSADQFLDEISHTTRQDKIDFARHLKKPQSAETDQSFQTLADEMSHSLDLNLVERIARSLIVRGCLDAYDFKRLHRR